jgi:CelD/BcsL family acetyltransferase involved in cellulose biosynthesis
MNSLKLTTRILAGFDDPSFGSADWARLLDTGSTNRVFLTWPYLRAWWESFGRGDLLLIVAERGDQVVALAPLFHEAGMIYFVGSGGSDYLDFVGRVDDPAVLGALLDAARACPPRFLGFRFYLVPDASPTGTSLREAAQSLDLECYDEGELVAPVLDMNGLGDPGMQATRKTSLMRHERFFQTRGRLEVRHFHKSEEILPQLPEFFGQHVARWAGTPFPSLFTEPAQCQFYERLTLALCTADWLRFTRIDWESRPIAFHFGFSYRGSYLWYKPSFAIELARRSPGEVLLRQLLIAALNERVREFDFGIGDEAFKRRFATRAPLVRTWGLYPAREPRHTARSGNRPWTTS